MQVEQVDFVSVLTQDIPRARAFSADVLGLEIETEGENDMEDGNALILCRRYATRG